MSETIAEIIEMPKFGKHPDANTLSIVQIYSFPVIFKSGGINIGDRAVYIGVDCVVPIDPRFAFLWAGNLDPKPKHRRIKAKKLRGIFSCGILLPISEFPELADVPVGTNVAEKLGITKYEDNVSETGGRNFDAFVKYTDIENARKYFKIIKPDEQVFVTEKIHGSNFRAGYLETKDENGNAQFEFFVGSHHMIKDPEDSNVFSRVAAQYDLKEKLRSYPGKIFFGEVYGPTQGGDGYHYGSKEKPSLIFFDVFDRSTGKYLDYWDCVSVLMKTDLPKVPTITSGKNFTFEELEQFADGPSLLYPGHNREGWVLRPEIERFEHRYGRVVVKLHGQDFLTLNKAKVYQ